MTHAFSAIHMVQRLSGKGEVVNCIEIVGCCKEIAADLVDGVNKLLPEAKVVTVKQVVATQQNVNNMMGRPSSNLSGDHFRRGWCGDCQLHVCQRLRATA